MVDIDNTKQLSLAELKTQSPSDLLKLAEKLEIENASSMRKGDMMFSILKDMAEDGVEISGDGVLEVLQDGFGFLRSTDANYLPGPDDIYVSPSKIKKFSLRTGDTVEGVIRAPKDGERYFGWVHPSAVTFQAESLTKTYNSSLFFGLVSVRSSSTANPINCACQEF
mgnify:CR=1 FL=1